MSLGVSPSLVVLLSQHEANEFFTPAKFGKLKKGLAELLGPRLVTKDHGRSIVRSG